MVWLKDPMVAIIFPRFYIQKYKVWETRKGLQKR
ncbi:MAG: hypothetical protein CM15mP106_4620 [Candidatus Neomarinimicrobiota bacterium]|nr:MAG: hypothetical protein CM15mP106_4620 [Candidatus Neomarinimicrobiota bacterium]